MNTDLFDTEKLGEFKKEELIEMVIVLQQEKNMLKIERAETKKETKSIVDRVTELERSHFLYLQYSRRESVEITGIPADIDHKNLEKEVLKIYNEAKVEVHGNKITNMDISACHRIGKHGVTIVRFVNRKFAMEGLYKGKNLKGSKLYGNSPIYINNSFCQEFGKYGYIIRNLKKRKLIEAYKIRNGVFQIKKEPDDIFVEISHVTDFGKYGLNVDEFL